MEVYKEFRAQMLPCYLVPFEKNLHIKAGQKSSSPVFHSFPPLI